MEAVLSRSKRILVTHRCSISKDATECRYCTICRWNGGVPQSMPEICEIASDQVSPQFDAERTSGFGERAGSPKCRLLGPRGGYPSTEVDQNMPFSHVAANVRICQKPSSNDGFSSARGMTDIGDIAARPPSGVLTRIAATRRALGCPENDREKGSERRSQIRLRESSCLSCPQHQPNSSGHPRAGRTP